MNIARNIVVPFCIVSLRAAAFADIEHTSTSCSVAIKTLQPELGPVTVRATVSAVGELEAVSVSYLSRTITLPAKALRGVKNVDIESKGSVSGIAQRVDVAKPIIKVSFGSRDPAYLKKAYGKDIGVPVTIDFDIDGLHSVDRAIMACTGPGIPYFGDFLDRRTFKLHADQ